MNFSTHLCCSTHFWWALQKHKQNYFIFHLHIPSWSFSFYNYLQKAQQQLWRLNKVCSLLTFLHASLVRASSPGAWPEQWLPSTSARHNWKWVLRHTGVMHASLFECWNLKFGNSISIISIIDNRERRWFLFSPSSERNNNYFVTAQKVIWYF